MNDWTETSESLILRVNSYAILRLITDEEPRSMREINPGIPDWLCSVVQKLMAKPVQTTRSTTDWW